MRRPPPKLADIREHVLNDAAELTTCTGLTNPLMENSVDFDSLSTVDRDVLLFLRGSLARHIVLVALRLHEPDHSGSTGHAASIDALLKCAEREAVLPETQVKSFDADLEQIRAQLESEGASYQELRAFRHMEIAHSLHPHVPLNLPLHYRALLDFAEDTFELVLEIDRALVASGLDRKVDLDERFHKWRNHGGSFWKLPDD